MGEATGMPSNTYDMVSVCLVHHELPNTGELYHSKRSSSSTTHMKKEGKEHLAPTVTDRLICPSASQLRVSSSVRPIVSFAPVVS